MSIYVHAHTHTHTRTLRERVHLKSELQHARTRSAAALLSHCLCYRPAVFFSHLRPLNPSTLRGKLRHALKCNCTLFNIFINFVILNLRKAWNVSASERDLMHIVTFLFTDSIQILCISYRCKYSMLNVLYPIGVSTVC